MPSAIAKIIRNFVLEHDMKKRLSDFWYFYREDLEKFIKQPRSVLFGFFLTAIIALSYLVSIWFFTLLILPFLYSLYPAYQISKPSDRLPIRVIRLTD